MKYTFLLIPFFSNSLAFAQPTASLPNEPVLKTTEEIPFPIQPLATEILRSQYLNLLREQMKLTCPRGTLEEYQLKYLAFKDDGFYVPQLQGNVDRITLKRSLPLLKEKLAWLKSVQKHIKNKPYSEKKIKQSAQKLKLQITALLQLRRQLEWKQGVSKQEMVGAAKKINGEFQNLMNLMPFLKNFKSPANHLVNRSTYEKLRTTAVAASEIQEKNFAYMVRKIYEDGTFNTSGARSDLLLRTAIDTVLLRAQDLSKFDEDQRYDVEWVLNQIPTVLSYGPKEIQRRVDSWTERTAQTISFYEKLIVDTQSPAVMNLMNSLKAREHAGEILRDYVQKKQSQVYKFWAKQEELHKAMFALETILLHEVGAAKVSNVLFREDVAQVVFNRTRLKEYSKFREKSRLFQLLTTEELLTGDEIQRERWLNTMFKEGEFSFASFFLSASKYTFCPDMSPIAVKSRNENIELIIRKLKNPRPKFDALRYFSRVSMVGKIGMESLWEGYEREPEEPGLFLEKTNSALKQEMAKMQFEFLYQFVDLEGRMFHVIRMNDVIYSVENAKLDPKFYEFRDPNLFRFFRKR